MNRYDWQRWFAWYPVVVDAYEVNEIVNGKMRYRVRFRWVERRIRGEVAPNGDLTDWWQYRLPQDATERTLRADYTRHPHCTTINHVGHE